MIEGHVAATDATGIASTAVAIDSTVMSNRTRSCDYTRPIPCTDESDGTHSIATLSLSDGAHRWSVLARDAASNVARSEPKTIYVDNHAPEAPVAAAVLGGDAWRQSNAFDVTWRNPDQGVGAPIAKVHYRICGAGGCQGEQVVDGAVDALRGMSVPGSGDWIVGVWLEDAAGNVDSARAATVHLRYGIDPTASSARAPAGLRLRWVVRRGRRLLVRGVVARGVRGTVVVRARPARRGARRPHVARRVRLSGKSSRFTAVVRLPQALRRARRLRVSLSYSGDFTHRRESLSRVVRPRARVPR